MDIAHNMTAARFECYVDGLLCRADYRMQGTVMQLLHTEVPPALEGRGIAAALVKAAFEFAAAKQLRVQPRCSYVRAYARRHPEVQALVIE
jgi:uncharacterized protein